MLVDLLTNGKPSHPAISLVDGPSINYGDLHRQVDDLSTSLPKLGLGKGDRIAMARPNRVPLSTGNLMTSARNVAETYQLTPNDVSLCVMPLFHVHGLVASTLATFFSGGTLIVPAKFNPLSFWTAVRTQRVTWYSAV